MLVFSFAKLSFSCSQLQALREQGRRNAKIRESSLFSRSLSHISLSPTLLSELLDYQTILGAMKGPVKIELLRGTYRSTE